MIKAIFFDIDGTLLSHKTHQVPPSTYQAFQQLKDKGIHTFVATGRHISEIQELPLDNLHFDAYVTLNGQYCYHQDDTIFDLPIHPQDVKNIIQWTQQHHIACAFVEEDIIYINQINDAVKKAQASISTPLPMIQDLNRGLTHPIYQIMIFGMSKDYQEELQKHIPHCQYTYWYDNAIDIVPSIGGKQNGIAKIMEHYHLSADECMAFGDGHNDICMFDLIPLSIAMGNASEEVKKHAYEVTDDIDENGIYNALKKHKII